MLSDTLTVVFCNQIKHKIQVNLRPDQVIQDVINKLKQDEFLEKDWDYVEYLTLEQNRCLDLTKTFSYYSIHDGDVIYIGLEKQFPGHCKKQGMVFQAECANKSCNAYNKIRYIYKGLGNFFVNQELFESNCSICLKTVFPAKDLGFYRSKGSCKGIITNGEQHKDIQIIVETNELEPYKRLIHNYQENAYKWAHLQIIVTKLEQ